MSQGEHNVQEKQFLTPGEVAAELRVSTSTVLRMIHADQLPAIAVSDRIYRIPAASFEMFKSGTLRTPGLAPLGRRKPRPRLGEGEGFAPEHPEDLARHG